MLTITFARDGRTWYGRKLYKVTLGNAQVGELTFTRMSVADSQQMVRRALEREVAEGRAFLVVDNR